MWMPPDLYHFALSLSLLLVRPCNNYPQWTTMCRTIILWEQFLWSHPEFFHCSFLASLVPSVCVCVRNSQIFDGIVMIFLRRGLLWWFNTVLFNIVAVKYFFWKILKQFTNLNFCLDSKKVFDHFILLCNILSMTLLILFFIA